jgi:hypothetical protein
MMKKARCLFAIAFDGAKSDAFTILIVNASDFARSTTIEIKHCDVANNPEEVILFCVTGSCQWTS